MANYNSAYTGAQIDVAVGSVINKTITAADVGAENPTGLINGNFRKPVNGRGASSYTGAVYGVDRWKGQDAGITVTVNSGYITVANAGGSFSGISQPIEDYAQYSGKQVTISVELSSTSAVRLYLWTGGWVDIGYITPTGTQIKTVTTTIPSSISALGLFISLEGAMIYS